MKKAAALRSAPGFEEVRRDILGWRSKRAGRSPMPEELWQEAVALARDHGVSMVSRELGLSYGKLKQRLNSEPSGQVFVELGLPGGCSVEFENARAERMRITLGGPCQGDLLALVEAFWSR